MSSGCKGWSFGGNKHLVLQVQVLILNSYGLCNFIKEPTRVTIEHASLIVLFIINVNIDKTFSASIATHLSDHMPIVAVIDIFLNKKNTLTPPVNPRHTRQISCAYF